MVGKEEEKTLLIQGRQLQKKSGEEERRKKHGWFTGSREKETSDGKEYKKMNNSDT